jgi:hypothetical protein
MAKQNRSHLGRHKKKQTNPILLNNNSLTNGTVPDRQSNKKQNENDIEWIDFSEITDHEPETKTNHKKSN